MKKIIGLMTLVVVLAMGCERDLEFETISTTEPALEVQVEGVATGGAQPKIEGAIVTLFSNAGQNLATATTNATGRVVFTKEMLGEKGVFSVRAQKDGLTGEATTPYLLLNDGITLLIVTVQ